MNPGRPDLDHIADALDAADDEELWRQTRAEDLGLPRGWVSDQEAAAVWARDKAAVEAEWDAALERERLRWVAGLAIERQEAAEAAEGEAA